MSSFPRPAEGTWTEHYPALGTGPVSFEDSVSPQFFELEREAIFRRAWLNVGRVDDLPRPGSWFTKDLVAARTSLLVVRDRDGQIRAFHNVCRHRGNKLVWSGTPRDDVRGVARQFACKYHGWRYGLDGACTYVHQPDEFFDLDRATLGLAPVHCDVWAGFMFVHLAEAPPQSLRDYLGPMVGALEGYPFDRMTERYSFRAENREQLEGVHRRLPGVLPRTPAAHAPARPGVPEPRGDVRGRALPARRAAPGREHERLVQARFPARAPVPERARCCAAATPVRGTRPTSAPTSPA